MNLREAVEEMLQRLRSIEQKVDKMSATTDTVAAELSALQAQVATDTTVEGSALTLIQGISAQIAAATAAAQAAGATPEQLAGFAAATAQLNANDTALASAVAANTPAAPAAS